MQNILFKKVVIFAVIVLFIGMSVIPSTGTTDVKQITMPTSNGKTLYVGGDGPGNYTKIQDAIDDASDGDTVFVYDNSSPYYERLIVGKSIVDYLVENDIGRLIIGHNDNWKQQCNIGRRNNQNFVSIPFYKLTHMLGYKCEEEGIAVDLKDESHTSKCSFFDDEPVGHHEKYVGKRNRGLFRTAKGYIVNADVNGGFNIMKKAVSNAFSKGRANGIEGVVSHPLRLTVPF